MIDHIVWAVLFALIATRELFRIDRRHKANRLREYAHAVDTQARREEIAVINGHRWSLGSLLVFALYATALGFELITIARG